MYPELLTPGFKVKNCVVSVRVSFLLNLAFNSNSEIKSGFSGISEDDWVGPGYRV